MALRWTCTRDEHVPHLHMRRVQGCGMCRVSLACAHSNNQVRDNGTLMWLLQWPGAVTGMAPQDPVHAQVRCHLLPPCCGTVDCMASVGRWPECGACPVRPAGESSAMGEQFTHAA